MLKTYLYVPDDLDVQIKQTAKLQNKSKAEVIRQALRNGIKTVGKQAKESAQVLLEIAKLGEKYNVECPKDASQKIDELLWGKNWN